MCRHVKIVVFTEGGFRKSKYCLNCFKVLKHRRGKYLVNLKLKGKTYRHTVTSSMRNSVNHKVIRNG